MSTENVLVEVSVDEKNLKDLVAEYERIHANYITALESQNTTDIQRILMQLETMNQEIQLLAKEMSDKINKINSDNKHVEYKEAIHQKRNDLNYFNNKMVADGTRIKNLMHDMSDLDGRNEMLRIQQITSTNFMYLYFVIIIILSILFYKFVISTEQDPIENIVLFLAIVLLLYFYRAKIMAWISDSVSVIRTNITYDSSSLLYRMLN